MKRKTATSRRVYTSVKEEIISGKRVPDSVLSESVLAEEFGASRTPVREALCMLENDGFVRRIPYQGYIVTSFTVDEVLDIIQVRIILEREAVRLAATSMQPQDIRQLEQVQKQGLSGEISPVEANRRFHQIIASKSGNGILTGFLHRLYDKCNRLETIYAEKLTTEEVLWGHEETLEALRRRDAEAAGETVVVQLNRFKDLILGQL